MLERTVGYYLPMMAGATVAFARSIPDLAEDLITVKPTVMIAVPRIFERIHGGIISKLKAKPKPMVALFHKAVETGWNNFLYQQGRAPWSISLLFHSLLDTLVAKKVRDKLGGRLRVIITGGAPLSAEISQVFHRPRAAALSRIRTDRDQPGDQRQPPGRQSAGRRWQTAPRN